jgi:hypothetical protein
MSTAGDFRERVSRVGSGRVEQVARVLQRKRGRVAPDIVLIRGGTMGLRDLEYSANVCKTKTGRPGVSVFGGAGLTVREVIKRSGIPHPKLRTCVVRKLEEAGFKVEQTGDNPLHYTVWLPRARAIHEELKDLARLFDEPLLVADLQE